MTLLPMMLPPQAPVQQELLSQTSRPAAAASTTSLE